MKKILLVAVLFVITSFTAESDVYICNSKGGKKYHFTRNCRGLSNCKAEIKKLTLSQAKNIGKTLCGYED